MEPFLAVLELSLLLVAIASVNKADIFLPGKHCDPRTTTDRPRSGHDTGCDPISLSLLAMKTQCCLWECRTLLETFWRDTSNLPFLYNTT